MSAHPSSKLDTVQIVFGRDRVSVIFADALVVVGFRPRLQKTFYLSLVPKSPLKSLNFQHFILFWSNEPINTTGSLIHVSLIYFLMALICIYAMSVWKVDLLTWNVLIRCK